MTVAEIPLRVITPADVRASIKRARKSLESAASEIVWQIEMEAWRTLGYSSWTAMREAEYGGAAFMVPSKSRPEIVARIRAAGLTQKEIAQTAGVTDRTVRNDLSTGKFSGSDISITNSRGQQRPSTYVRTETFPCSNCETVTNFAERVEIDSALYCEHCADEIDDVIDAEIVDGPQDFRDAPDRKTDPAPAESVNHRTCPTCHGTGEITS